jgi:hypothetical protein
VTEELVPATRTPATTAEMVAGFTAAWAHLFDVVPKKEQLAVVWAQWALETGRGKFMVQYNLGNVKRVPGDGYSYYQIRCNEIINGKIVWFDPPSPYTSFRAFPSLAAGCAEYLKFISRHYAAGWAAVQVGDPAQYGHALKLAHYFTDVESHYVGALTSLWHEFMATPMPTVPPHEEGLTDVDRAETMALVDRTIAESLLDIGATHGRPTDPPPVEPNS